MRILLKISGEALKWIVDFWIDSEYTKQVAKLISDIKKQNIELAIVVWWWNIYRWSDLIASWVDASDSHNLSMLSTVFNWVVLKNFLEKAWLQAVVMDPNGIKFVEEYDKDKARKYLENDKVVICTWWTWNPYFTTDTWWVLRSLELKCDMMIKATKVDGVYDSDPVTNPSAKFFEEISYDEIIKQNLKVMDQTAVSLAKEAGLELRVVNLSKKGAVLNVIKWKKEGTVVK